MDLCPWDSLGMNIGVGCQGIFLTRESNPQLTSPALAGVFFTTSATWKAQAFYTIPLVYVCVLFSDYTFILP